MKNIRIHGFANRTLIFLIILITGITGLFIQSSIDLNNKDTTLFIIAVILFLSFLGYFFSTKEAIKSKQNFNSKLKKLTEVYGKNVIAYKVDLNKNFKYISEAFKNISNYSKEDLIGKNLNIIYHEDLPELVIDDIFDSITSGQNWQGELTYKTKDSNRYWTRATITPDYNKENELVGFTVIETDITAEIKAELLHYSVNNLLKNIDQGVLSFNGEMKVEEGYSNKCMEIFGIKKLKHHKIDELLFAKDLQKRKLFNKGINSVNETLDISSKMLLISLLPKEAIINGKIIKLSYKFIDNYSFMLILDDITKTAQLEKEISIQHQIQKMIVAIVANKNEFLDLKKEFEEFLPNLDLKDIDKSLAVEYLRKLHTFKGLFAQKEFTYIVDAIHEFEMLVQHKLEEYKNVNVNLNDIFNSSNLKEKFVKDINNISEILGSDYFDTIEKDVKSAALNELEEKLRLLIEQNIVIDGSILKNILYDVLKLNREPFYKMLASYPILVEKMSEKFEKPMDRLEIVGDNKIFVKSEFKNFTKSLIHIFRNAMDHGIEDDETRFINGKPDKGHIKCFFEEQDSHLILKIMDDGAGIDSDKVVEKAIDKGIINEKDSYNLSEEDKLNLIFKDSISTKEKVTQISGRGVGLSAVKEEIEKLGGEIKIINRINIGTAFIFKIPLNNDKIELYEELKMITLRAQNYFKEDLSLNIIGTDDYIDFKPKKDVVVLEFSGDFKALCILELSDQLMNYLANILIPDGFSDEDVLAMKEDLPKEILNTFTGHVIHDFRQIGYKDVSISIPFILNESNLKVKLDSSKEKAFLNIKTSQGDVICGIIK